MNTFQRSYKEVDRKGAKARDDSKSTLRTLPTSEYATYMVLACSCVAVWAASRAFFERASSGALAAAAMAGFGPVVLACLMTLQSRGWKGGVLLLLEPFETHSPLMNVAHLCLGALFCSVPITWACYLAA